MIKKFVKKYFESFAFFYSFLGYRIFIIVGFNLLIGILDGFGLTMFLPLLQMVDGSSNVDSDSMGKLSFLVDFLQNSGIPLNLFSVLVFMAFFFFAKGITQYLAGIYKVSVQQWFMKRLRVSNIRGLNNLSYKYFVTSDVGRIQNTLTGEIGRISIAFTNYFKALEYGILVMIYMAFAFSVDAQFAVLVTIGGVLTNFLYKSLYKNTKGISRTLTGETNVFQGLIIQNVANYKYLKATGSLKRYAEKLEESVKGIEKSNKKIGKLEALLTAGREPILISVVVAVIFIQTTYLGSQLGPILISLVFFYRALNYLMQMQVRWNKFLSVSGSLENIVDFGKELRANKETKGKEELKGPVERFQLRDVSFYYDETIVINKISLEINSKETVAFVGESGSGKTTLVNIIAGLLPIDRGEFLINGLNSRQMDVRSLQKRTGYITQDPVIFNDTVFNNVSFWDEKTETNLRRFWKAVQQAAILDFIEELPDREDEILGNNGTNLSGGQRQRISIARELYKDVEILILDEATSALDSETERAIQQNIDELKGKYTILIVAHRISTVKNADRIVVMSKGKITNIGAFKSLIESSPYFKKLVELQEV
ncbi:ABC transporter ATP-binding protein [Salinimicrobium sediminilitoris]|uniref:ABC transporter ATP-binding protein n=1 Tax=Salinimicrobium sediminilitoris TaxID=2876715 RepID=UPI001E3756EE|nr:ABC transporter ATP-binding protein [Salinimicrobium sediminilitoris]MCC8358768.1 ABC transporter ATP-binding protein/permease [Salinimicrobium sediminilitoris]